MAVGAFIEPLIVVTLLFGGAWFNRDKDYDFWKDKHGSEVDLHLKRSDVVEEREYSMRCLFRTGFSIGLHFSSGSIGFPLLFTYLELSYSSSFYSTSRPLGGARSQMDAFRTISIL